MTIFNGLKGAENAIYNYLTENSTSNPISMSMIANETCYDYRAIWNAMQRLIAYGLIRRFDGRPGVPYRYEVKEK